MLALFAFWSSQLASAPQTTKTTNAHSEWHLTHLNNRFASVIKAQKGIVVVEDWPDNPKKSVFSIGYSFTEADHHGQKKYTILKTEDDGVIIEYFSRFDHSSFGKNLIEEDSGTVK